MKLAKTNQTHLSSALLKALFVVLFCTALVLTGCSTTAKKKKPKKSEDEPEITEVGKEESNTKAPNIKDSNAKIAKPESTKANENSANTEIKETENADAEGNTNTESNSDQKELKKKPAPVAKKRSVIAKKEKPPSIEKTEDASNNGIKVKCL